MNAVTVVVACAMLAGCGSANTAAVPAVKLSMTAPVDRAVVTVAKIEVFGTTDPKNAVVQIGGQRVRVVNGVFERRMTLRKGTTRISVVATARGYQAASARVAVQYVPARPRGRSEQLTLPVTGKRFIARCSTTMPDCECAYLVWARNQKVPSSVQMGKEIAQAKRYFAAEGITTDFKITGRTVMVCSGEHQSP